MFSRFLHALVAQPLVYDAVQQLVGIEQFCNGFATERIVSKLMWWYDRDSNCYLIVVAAPRPEARV